MEYDVRAPGEGIAYGPPHKFPIFIPLFPGSLLQKGAFMEQVNTIELHDENTYPDDTVLKNTLGKSFEVYKELLGIYDKNGMTYEWRYYRDGKAWLCKVQKKKRTIVWMSAWKGYMKATIYFPEKHITTLKNLDIGEEMKNRIMESRNVGKSKPCMFEIKNKKILIDFNKVMQLKIAER